MVKKKPKLLYSDIDLPRNLESVRSLKCISILQWLSIFDESFKLKAQISTKVLDSLKGGKGPGKKSLLAKLAQGLSSIHVSNLVGKNGCFSWLKRTGLVLCPQQECRWWKSTGKAWKMVPVKYWHFTLLNSQNENFAFTSVSFSF